MELRTFKATTMAECLAQVKTTLGLDAVILHTRQYDRRHWLGLRKRVVVEITAGKGQNLLRHRPRTGTDWPHRTMASPAPSAVRVQAPPGNGNPVRPASLLENKDVQHLMLAGVTREIDCLKGMVKDLVSKVCTMKAPSVHEDLLEHFVQLTSQLVAENIASEIVGNIHRSLRPDALRNTALVRDRIAAEIEKLLPTTGPIVRKRTDRPHVVALVGPTGVGKTTTIAKLAAKLKLSEKRRVGLITIDTYRIAAIDQLKKYADILGAPFRVVGVPEDLRDAMTSMADCDFILIDTVGRSPNDSLKLSELRAFISAASPDEVHLVLSSTASQENVELATSRFADLKFDRVIFTKLDEAAHIGTVLNVVRKVNTRLSYITTGQDVPADIEVGQGRRLAMRILGEDPDKTKGTIAG